MKNTKKKNVCNKILGMRLGQWGLKRRFSKLKLLESFSLNGNSLIAFADEFP